MMSAATPAAPPRLALAAGGTGGHMIPAAAFAREMESRGWRVELFTDDRGLRFADQFPESVRRTRLPVGSVFRGSLWHRLWQPFAILSSSLGTALRFRRRRAMCVVAFGGYVTAPVLLGSMLAKVPYVLHEQNAVLGRVNRMFARRAKRVACGLPLSKYVHDNSELTGTPVRREVQDCADVPYQPPDATGAIRVLIAGGSQGSHRVAVWGSRALAALPEDLRRRLIVACQARPEDIDTVMQNFHEGAIRAEVSEFFADLPLRLRDCHLVIARAGASSLAEIAAVGRPAVLIPLPSAADNHQFANAQSVTVGGGATSFEEHDGSAEKLSSTIEGLLTDPARLSAMADAMRATGKVDAAQVLADVVERCTTVETESRK